MNDFFVEPDIDMLFLFVIEMKRLMYSPWHKTLREKLHRMGFVTTVLMKGRGSIRPKNGPYGKHISVHSRSCSTIRDSHWQQKKPHIQCIRRRESSNILSSKIIEKSSIASTSDSQGGMPQASTRLKTIQSGVVLHEEQESPYEGVFENHVPGVKKCIYY